MKIDAVTFRAIAKAILPSGASLTSDEAAAIVQLGFVMTRADVAVHGGEYTLREQVAAYVCSLGGIRADSIPTPSPLPLPGDPEARHALLRELCARIQSRAARELAYVLAALLAIEDLALARIESVMLRELQVLLGVDDARANELVAHAMEQVTPMDQTASSSG